jgi:hypothetical protein
MAIFEQENKLLDEEKAPIPKKKKKKNHKGKKGRNMEREREREIGPTTSTIW